MEPPALAAVCAAFDAQRSEQFTLPIVVAMVAFLKSATATFKGYDPIGAGTITLSLNQFVYASANTR